MSEAHLNVPSRHLRFQRKPPQSCLHEERQRYLGDRAKCNLGATVPKSVPLWNGCPGWSETHSQFLLEKIRAPASMTVH